MEEIWKTMIYQGKEYSDFEVSNIGRMRNVLTGTIYKQSVNSTGYYSVRVTLGSRDKKKSFRIHKAVAETFVPNPENKPDVNHKDGNRLNNNAYNLEWSTEKENTRHAWDTGLALPRKGSKSPSSKLTDEQVKYIREHYIAGDKEFGRHALAKKFNVHYKTIADIANYKRYIDTT